MPLTIHYQSSATVAETLEAIKRTAPYWRESEVPTEISDRGGRGVSFRSSGARFSLFIDAPGDWLHGFRFRLTGKVVARADRGTEVVIRAGLSPLTWPGIIVSALIFGSSAPEAALAAYWPLLPAAMVIAAGLAVRTDRRMSRTSDPRVEHLLDRMELAIAALPEGRRVTAGASAA